MNLEIPGAPVAPEREGGRRYRPEDSDMNRLMSMYSFFSGAGEVPENGERVTGLIVAGNPPSKARPRFSSSPKGRVVVYNSEQQRAQEEVLQWELRKVFRKPLESNVFIGCIFYRKTLQRIDADNMLKHVLDSANGIIWHDDMQVTGICAVVEFDRENPRTGIVIGPHSSSLRRGELTTDCEQCGKSFVIPKRGVAAPRRFCSRACRAVGIGGVDLSVPVACAQCGTPFLRRSHQSKFCSVACSGASFRGKPKPQPNMATCRDCGVLLVRPAATRCRDCWKRSRGEQS